MDKGFWGVNYFIFLSWDARYTATFLSAAFFQWTGLKYYGLSAFCLIIATFGSSFLLASRLAPKDYSYWRLSGFTLIFWVFYWLIAKPDALGGADFVLVGQFLYRAGSYCYQTSLILVFLIVSFLIDFHQTQSKTYRKILWVLIITSLILLVGTNEGTAIMMFLVIVYGLYKSFSNPVNLNLWLVMCFVLGGVLVWMIYGSGDQVRVFYYQIKPHLYPMDHDWVFAISLGLSQTLFLMLSFLLNPVTWFLTWLLYPELSGFLKTRASWISEQDLWVIVIGLIFVGFFSDAWAMGVYVPPRYYGVMATLGFFASLGLLTCMSEILREKFKYLKQISWPGFVIAGISLILTIYLHQVLIPVVSDLSIAISKASLFDASYKNIVKKLELAQAKHQDQIILSRAEFLPEVPILDYFVSIPSSRFEGPVSLEERTKSLAADLAFYYGVKKVKIQ